MKLRSTLGALSSLFADPTQGSRLPDIGVDIHGLKAAVERNDKSYLLDLGELLRERVGMHKQGHQAEKGMQKQEQGSSVDSPSNQPEVSRLREPNSKRAPYNAFEAEPVVFGELTEQGEKMAQQRQDKSSGSTSRQLEAPNLWEPSSKKDALEMEAPIFGSLTAKAEKELLEKIRISGETFESGGLGMLNGPRSPLKGNDNKADEISSMQQEPMSSMEELYRVFQQTTKMEEVAPAQTSANTYSHQATGQGSSTGTPVDYNEYLKSSVLNGGNDDIMNMDFNQFLFPSGPSPPGFQMPDFTNLGLPSIPAYGSHNAPYTSANAYAAATPSTLLQPPHSYSASSTPAFGLPSSASPSAFPSKISETDNAVNTTAQPTSVVSAISASLGGATSKSYADLREASKTLHKQAKQLIKL